MTRAARRRALAGEGARLTTLSAALAMLLTAALLTAAPAGARIIRPVSSFTPVGVEGPHGVAVDQATGDLFVAGEGSHNVVEFSAGGTPFVSFVSPVFEEEPEDVAVDNSSGASKGDVYVAGFSLGVVKLDSSGAQAAGFTPITASSIPAGDPGSEEFKPDGVAVNPENGDVVVADHSNEEVDIFSSSGAFVSQFPVSSSLYGVAVGSDGEIFTATGAGALVWSAPSYAAPVQIGPSEPAYAIAVDLSTGNVLVNGPGEPRSVEEYEASGAHTLLLQFGSGLIEYSNGVAVDERTDTVYAPSPESGEVEVFGPSVRVPSVLTGTPATGVTSTTANVSGAINPEGSDVAGCSVEYGLSVSYGYTAVCSPQPPFTGVDAVPVAASLERLQPGKTYHYRLVAIAGGIPTYGEDETFATPAAAPAIADESVSALTQTSATLGALVNPDNQATTYRFEYGTSAAYGTVLPVPDAGVGSGYGNVAVGQRLTGLQADTTYHFRLVATNASSPAGGTAGPDQTFTTPPLEPPVLSTGQAVGVAQNTATLTGTIDARGHQTDYEFDFGTDTSYGTRIFGDAGAEPGVNTFSVTLQGLMPGTTYHYRVAATNTFGTSYGADVTFTTSTYPSALLSEPVAPVLLPAIVLAAEPVPGTSGRAKAKAKAASLAQKAGAARRAGGGHRHGRARRSGRGQRTHKEHGHSAASHRHSGVRGANGERSR
jgi:hypothetical protein